MFELKPLAGITPAGADSAVGLAPILYCGSEGKPGLGTVSSKERTTPSAWSSYFEKEYGND